MIGEQVKTFYKEVSGKVMTYLTTKLKVVYIWINNFLDNHKHNCHDFQSQMTGTWAPHGTLQKPWIEFIIMIIFTAEFI